MQIKGGALTFNGPGQALCFTDAAGVTTPMPWADYFHWMPRHLEMGEPVSAAVRRLPDAKVGSPMFVGRLTKFNGTAGEIACEVGNIKTLEFRLGAGKTLRAKVDTWVWFRIESKQENKDIWAGRVSGVSRSVAQDLGLSR